MIDLTPYAGLQPISGFDFPIRLSPALIGAAAGIAQRFQQTTRFLSQLLNVTPEVGLAILSAQDWPQYAALPLFGVTHYDYPRRIVVTAAEPSVFWQPVLGLVRADSGELMQRLQAVYGQPDGHIDLTPHVDLFLSHDIGHAFHLHTGYWFPRRWLMEYFADLCAYTYIAIQEPAQLPALETLPLVLQAVSRRDVHYHRWQDFDTQYGSDSMSIANYFWYHGHLFAAAKQEYQATGINALQRLWQAFVVAKIEKVTDAALMQLLWQTQPHLAQMMDIWELKG